MFRALLIKVCKTMTRAAADLVVLARDHEVPPSERHTAEGIQRWAHRRMAHEYKGMREDGSSPRSDAYHVIIFLVIILLCRLWVGTWTAPPESAVMLHKLVSTRLAV